MRTVTGLLLFLVTCCPAWAQQGNATDDVRKGHHLATLVCAICHVAAADQPYEPVLRPPAPSFASIAQRNDLDAAKLQKFIATTHRGLDEPNGMPNPELLDSQVKEVVAYLLSLRQRH
jgi:mono/diheme cytochrome c family protein